MPEKKYFVRLAGAAMIGIVSLILAGIIFFLLLPFFIPLAVLFSLGLMAILIFVAIWGVIYIAMFIGTALFYLTKPMNVKKTGTYTINKTKEAGRRQKSRR